jgi:hypothetical protein
VWNTDGNLTGSEKPRYPDKSLILYQCSQHKFQIVCPVIERDRPQQAATARVTAQFGRISGYKLSVFVKRAK